MELSEVSFYFHQEAYSTNSEKLMGRNAAGESFLKGYLQHNTAEKFWALAENENSAKAFSSAVASHRPAAPVTTYTSAQLALTESPGNLYFPGPDIGKLAYRRTFFGDTKWSICGITHTTSSDRSMDAITEWLTAPVHPWDAIVCPSKAVKQHAEGILEAEKQRLTERLGASSYPNPELPVIPLGINVDDFHFSDNERIKARAKIFADDRAFVVLFLGRLSFHCKAHPLTMYRALESVATATGREIKLIECGWYANEYTQRAYEQAWKELCPSVQVIYLDGRDPQNRQLAWASADVFCSLADNIQETFGISPVEAMAVGLPVVVSDWDGYRDTVTSDCGFRIPTLKPIPGLGLDFAYRYATGLDNYDFYCGHTSSFVGVDLTACTDAFTRLLQDRNLRLQMGEAGKKRAREHYDWSILIPEYERLWGHLGEIRRRSEPLDRSVWPARMDPYRGFAHYSTANIGPLTKIRRKCSDINDAEEQLRRLLNLEMVRYASAVLPDTDQLSQTLRKTPSEWVQASSLASGAEPELSLQIIRSVGFLYKLGVIEIEL